MWEHNYGRQLLEKSCPDKSQGDFQHTPTVAEIDPQRLFLDPDSERLEGTGQAQHREAGFVVSIDVQYYSLDYSLVFSAIAHRRKPILNRTFHVLLHTHIMHSFGLYAIFGTHIDIIRTEHRIVFTPEPRV
jgi:hypothetical protein